MAIQGAASAGSAVQQSSIVLSAGLLSESVDPSMQLAAPNWLASSKSVDDRVAFTGFSALPVNKYQITINLKDLIQNFWQFCSNFKFCSN